MELKLIAILWYGFIIFSIVLFKWCLNYLRNAKLLSAIPGPKGIPILGNALDLIDSNYNVIIKLKMWWNRFSENSGMFKIVLLHKNFIILCRPEIIKDCINKNLEKTDFYSFINPWIGNGLITSGGAKWKTRRKLLTPTFHIKILDGFMSTFNTQSKLFTNKLMNSIEKPFDVYPHARSWAVSVLCETIMGEPWHAEERNCLEYTCAVENVLHMAYNRTIQPWLWPNFAFALSPMGRKYKQNIKILHDFTRKIIQGRRANRKQKSIDLIDDEMTQHNLRQNKRQALLDFLLEIAEEENSLTEEGIQEEVDTFMFAGHHTSAIALSCTLYLLGHNPKVQRKLIEELDTVLGPEIRDITSDDLRKLNYLDCVIKESLRLYPPIGMIGRQLKEDDIINSHTIPAGTFIVLLQFLIHRDPVLYPDPDDFNPDRFATDNAKDRHPYSYMAFSNGPRNCIGQKFGLMEQKVVLCHVLRSLKIESIQPIESLKISYELMLNSKDGFVLKLAPRRNIPIVY